MNDAAFLAELRDAARINELEDQRAEMRDAVREASQEAELYEGQPVMHLPNDLYMMFEMLSPSLPFWILWSWSMW